MILIDIAVAVAFALVFSVVLVSLLRRRGPGPASGFLFFFILFFLFIWAGGVWLQPFGPMLSGIPLVVFLLVGLVALLLMLALTPPPGGRLRPMIGTEADMEVATETALSCSFWVLLLILVSGIAAHYVWLP